jgi:RimJ/RimL family protein N-acetyltransferase
MLSIADRRGGRPAEAAMLIEQVAPLGPAIATDRLLLTRRTPADSEAFFAYRSLPEVCRYQSWAPLCLQDAVTFIERLQGVPFASPGTWFQLGVRLRETGELVGDLGVHFVGDGRQVEIGFTLAPVFQGRGLGTEAVAALLGYLFGELGTHRVFASVDPANRSSLRLLQRVGMRQEAHFLQSVLFKGEWADDMVFAILASEWRARG